MQRINIKYHHSGCTRLRKQKGKRTSNKGVNEVSWSVVRSDSLSAFCREEQSIAAAKQSQAWRWGQATGHVVMAKVWETDICRLNGGHYHDMYTIKSMLDGDDANLLLF